MKIDIWMDFVCPYCYLGKHRLEAALKQLSTNEPVDLVYHAYELDPRARLHSGKTMPEELAERHGIDFETTLTSMDDLREQGMELGLDINPASAPVTNTHDAHRLVSYAVTVDNKIAFDFIEGLFEAHFKDNKDIGEPPVLLELATKAGLDADSVVEVLVSEAFRDKVIQDRKSAREVGLQGVPHFVINDRYTISGAQYPGKIVKFLLAIQNENV